MDCFAPTDLTAFTQRVLTGLDLSERDAGIVADCLVDANLRGVDSHGIRLLPIYARRLALSVAHARPNVRTIREGPAYAVVDGGHGLGPVVGAYAMNKAVELARAAGVAAVAVRNSNHFGAAAWYARQAAAQGMIGFATTNGTPALAPWGGRRPFFGANPMAVVVPAGQESPIVFDMATSISSRGRIRQAAANAQPIPAGWAVDKQGRPTTDARDALEGALLPVGGAKGYGIALVLEVLAGALAGADFSPANRDLYGDLSGPQGLGHFFSALDPAAFLPDGSFGTRIDRLVCDLRNVPPAEGVAHVRVPGDMDAQRRRWRTEHGIGLTSDVIAELGTVGRAVGVVFPRPIG